VEFSALDGQPVHLIFLLVSAPDTVEPHVEALRKVTALLKDDDFCTFLRRAKDKAEMSDLLREVEERWTR
jgi:mannitol/fructose-specific phosphotransferase system IIA component (Ntr-type)